MLVSSVPHAAGLVFLAVLFGFASAHKLLDIPGFKGVLNAYFEGVQFAGRDARSLLAMLIIAWEVSIVIAAAIALLIPTAVTVAALLSAVLLLVYAAAMATNLARGNPMQDCGCSWGKGDTPVSYMLVARNAFLAGLAGLLLIPAPAIPFGFLDAANVMAISILAYIVYLVADQLIINHGRIQGGPR